MKFSHLIFLGSVLSLLPSQSLALKCGIKGVTEPCIGATDARYDPDVGFNLEEQNDIYKSLEGLYMGEICFYNGDGTPEDKYYLNNVPKEVGLGSFDLCNTKVFKWITVVGSRFSMNRYLMAKHNADGVAFQGQLPGFIFPTDIFYTSTFEKDGGALSLQTVIGFYSNFTVAEERTSMHPVAGKALFGTADAGTASSNGQKNYLSLYCVDSDCDQVNTYTEEYIVDPESGSDIVKQFSRESLKKVNKETWMAGVSQAYIDYSVPTPELPFTRPGFNISYFTQPFDPTTTDTLPECSTLACPTENDWKSVDPVFGKSPYVEPSGVLTGGFIAGITIASIVIAVAIFSYVYKRGVKAQVKRVKDAVLKSIAKSMTVTMAQKPLTPRELEDIFKKIDTDGNGSISKDEVKGLVDEAGVANMSERDYNILFDSIDLDENGTLDFAEFCAFFTSIASSDDSGSDFIRASILHAGNCAEV